MLPVPIRHGKAHWVQQVLQQIVELRHEQLEEDTVDIIPQDNWETGLTDTEMNDVCLFYNKTHSQQRSPEEVIEILKHYNWDLVGAIMTYKYPDTPQLDVFDQSHASICQQQSDWLHFTNQ
jgi:hypothetical protein